MPFKAQFLRCCVALVEGGLTIWPTPPIKSSVWQSHHPKVEGDRQFTEMKAVFLDWEQLGHRATESTASCGSGPHVTTITASTPLPQLIPTADGAIPIISLWRRKKLIHEWAHLVCEFQSKMHYCCITASSGVA